MIHTNINKVQNWLSHNGCECDTDNEGVKCFHCKAEIMMENFGRELIYYVKKIKEIKNEKST